MRSIIAITVISIFILGCTTDKRKLEKAWIGKYSSYRPKVDSDNKTNISSSFRGILDFRGDSVTIKPFNLDFTPGGYGQKTVLYELTENQLVLKEPNNSDTIIIQDVFSDSLIFDPGPGYSGKKVFEALGNYHQGLKEVAFYDFITTASFAFLPPSRTDSVRVEFRTDGLVIDSAFNFFMGDNGIWTIDTYQEELFLMTDGLLGFQLQVKAFDQNGFSGIIYGEKNIELEFKRLPDRSKFDLANLFGKWERSGSQGSIPPPPLPSNVDNPPKYYSIETLEISDSILLQYQGYNVNMIKWKSNREEDILIFRGKEFPLDEGQWNLIALSENELVVERRADRGAPNAGEYEKIKFEKSSTNEIVDSKY